MTKADLSNFSRRELAAAVALRGTRAPNGCLEWAGPKRPAGYGLTRIRGMVISVHRIACCLAHGLPEKGQDACHSCDNPSCFEESHLFWGTRAQNMLDASAKKRLWQNKATHCPKGHPLSERPRARGERYCPQCKAIRQRKYRALSAPPAATDRGA